MHSQRLQPAAYLLSCLIDLSGDVGILLDRQVAPIVAEPQEDAELVEAEVDGALYRRIPSGEG